MVLSTNRKNADLWPRQFPGPARPELHLGHPAGSHLSNTNDRLQCPRRPPCLLLGPTSVSLSPGLPAAPAMHRPPPGLGQPLSRSLRRLGQAARREEVSGRELATFLESPPCPSLSQTHWLGSLDIQGRLIVRVSMLAPDPGWGSLGPWGGRETSGCQPPTPGGDPHTLCWAAVFLAGLGPWIPITSWAGC